MKIVLGFVLFLFTVTAFCDTIKSLETFYSGKDDMTIIRLNTTLGYTAYGQTAHINAIVTTQVFHLQVAPHAIGRDPDNIERLLEDIIYAEYKLVGPYLLRALSGLDTALWDLRGIKAGKPVVELLGGKVRALPVYGSSLIRTTTPEAEAARMLQLHRTKGVNAFKCKIAKRMGNDTDQWPGRTPAMIQTLRETLGPNVTLMADANGGYSGPETALKTADLLAKYNYFWFEEPVPFWSYYSDQNITQVSKVKIAAGEQEYRLDLWQEMIKIRAVDILQPDMNYIGGITRAWQVAQWAADSKTYNYVIDPHNPTKTMSFIFTLHFFGAVPNPGPFVEYGLDSSPDDLFSPFPEIINGAVEIPSGPGWGVKINPHWLARAQYAVSHL